MLTTRDVAARLGVSDRRVRAMVAAGDLPAEQVGGRWLIDELSVPRVVGRTGRPWAPATSWALLEVLSGVESATVSEATRARIRRRLRTLSAEDIARAVATRTRVHRFDAEDPAAVLRDITPTGRTALSALDTGLVADTRHVDGYPRTGTIAELAKRHLLLPHRDGSVTLFEGSPTQNEGRAIDAIVAADAWLVGTTRERAAALKAIEQMLSERR